MVHLSDVCSILMGQSPSSNTYNTAQQGLPFYQGNADFGAIYPKKRVWCSSPVKIAKAGDILISVRAPIGALNIADTECCIGRGLAALSANEDVCLRKYLWYVLKFNASALINKGTGSTFKAINKQVLMELEFDLPSIEKQAQIVEQLDKTTTIISKKTSQLAKLDELVKSQFIEMFETGEYPLTRIENVVDRNIIRANKKFSFDDEIEYLDISSIDNESMCVIGATKYLLKNAPSRAQYILEKGDILYSTVRPNLQNIAINPYDGDNIVGSTGFCVLRCRGVRPEYLWGVITGERFTKSMIALASGANYPAVTDKTVLGYEIPLPTDDEQMRFARLIEKTDKSKNDYELRAA